MALTIYADFFSAPARAVTAFCIITKIPHKIQKTQILTGDNRTQQYAKINPLKLVPAITHGDFSLYESNSILAYLADYFEVADHWFPKDAKSRAQVLRHMHWHHLNTRFSFSGYFFRKFVKVRLTGRELPQALQKEMLIKQQLTLKFIQQALMETGFLAGTSQISIADIAAYCEIAQSKIWGMSMEKYPRVMQWMAYVGNLDGIREVEGNLVSVSPNLQ